MHDIATIGPALRRLREKAGITQKVVAQRLGLNRTGPSSYEQPGANPQTQNLLRYLDAVGANFADLEEALAKAAEPDALDDLVPRFEELIRGDPGFRRVAQEMLSRLGANEASPKLRALERRIEELEAGRSSGRRQEHLPSGTDSGSVE